MQNQLPRFLKFKERPYELLGLIGFLLVIFSFIPISHGSYLDISLHDTYYVVANFNLYRFFGIFLLFFWSAYLITKRFLLSQLLIWIHVLLTLLPLIIVCMVSIIHPSLEGVPRRYYAFTDFQKMQSSYFNLEKLYLFVFLLFCFGQAIFLINISGGLIKRMLR